MCIRDRYATGQKTDHLRTGILIAVGALVLSLVMVALIVFINDSERRLPVQYAKKVVGRKMYGGQNSTLPIKLNNTGVMQMCIRESDIRFKNRGRRQCDVLCASAEGHSENRGLHPGAVSYTHL